MYLRLRRLRRMFEKFSMLLLHLPFAPFLLPPSKPPFTLPRRKREREPLGCVPKGPPKGLKVKEGKVTPRLPSSRSAGCLDLGLFFPRKGIAEKGARDLLPQSRQYRSRGALFHSLFGNGRGQTWVGFFLAPATRSWEKRGGDGDKLLRRIRSAQKMGKGSGVAKGEGIY